MQENSSSAYFLTRKTADEYRRKGYDVAFDVPLDFLPGFRADLVVRKQDEAKVIEVESRSSLAANPRIAELARAIDSRPGWSFDLLLVAEPGKLDSPEGARPLDREQVLRRTRDAETALASDLPEAALVLAWSACEAAARVLVAEQDESDPDIIAPGYFLDRAVFLGIMSREEYRDLAKARQYRNAILHAFCHDHFGDDLVTSVIDTVHRLLAAAK